MGVPNPFAEFVDAVAKMRAAQRDYFRDRTAQALQRSKELEFSVDNTVARLRREIRGLPTQQTLFDGRAEGRGGAA